MRGLFCFLFTTFLFPHYVPIYTTSYEPTSYGLKGTFRWKYGKGPFPPDCSLLHFEIYFQTDDRVHVKIFDPQRARLDFSDVVQAKEVRVASPNPQYYFEFPKEGGIIMRRKQNGRVIFDSHSTRIDRPMVVEPGFIQMSTRIASSPLLYGLGQRRTRFTLPYPYKYYFNNCHREYSADGQGLSGSHPFHIEARSNGEFHGVFFNNFSPTEVEVQSGCLTWRAMNGPIDFYVFIGPSMKDVIDQYTSIVGRPCLQPQWAFGFHHGARGYSSLDKLREAITLHAANQIPLDAIWNDVDYMRSHLDFTTDPENYPTAGFRSLILSDKGANIHHVPIVNTGVAVANSQGEYAPYDDLVQSKLFLRNRTQQPFVGSFLGHPRLFPDYFSPDTLTWTRKWIGGFVNNMSFSGVWLDANEVSQDCNGECVSAGLVSHFPWVPTKLEVNAPPATSLTVRGPYWQHHNLYALRQARQARRVLLELNPGKRPIILSRASFSGSGMSHTTWIGDTRADWEDLQDSVAGVLTFGIVGMPFVGADVGGYTLSSQKESTTAELLTRWTAVGAFLYPFFREYTSELQIKPHSLFSFGSPYTGYNRAFLNQRQSIQCYLYTLHHIAHERGTPIIRPLMMEFPHDTETYTIDRQAMVGEALLVSPVMDHLKTSVSGCYFPSGRWYDFHTLKEDPNVETGPETSFGNERKRDTTNSMVKGGEMGGCTGKKNVTLTADIDSIPVHIRGGIIFPIQETSGDTITQMRESPITLICALDWEHGARGFITVDDGESVNQDGNAEKTTVHFTIVTKNRAENAGAGEEDEFGSHNGEKPTGTFTAKVTEGAYTTQQRIASIKILGLNGPLQKMQFSDNRPAQTTFDPESSTVIITPTEGQEDKWLLKTDFILTWEPT